MKLFRKEYTGENVLETIINVYIPYTGEKYIKDYCEKIVIRDNPGLSVKEITRLATIDSMKVIALKYVGYAGAAALILESLK